MTKNEGVPPPQVGPMNRLASQLMQILDRLFRKRMCYVILLAPAGEPDPSILYSSNLDTDVATALLIRYLNVLNEKQSKEDKNAD